MRANDRTWRPALPAAPAPLWVWATTLAILALLGLAAVLSLALA